MQTLDDFIDYWEPTEAKCKTIHETFCALVNDDPELKALRDWVEENHWGMGERSFYWMWKLITQELPEDATMLEIGVHRGQTLALWRVLDETAYILGVSPMNGAEVSEERDYMADVETIFKQFNLSPPATIVRGYSENPETIDWTTQITGGAIDVLYIDGGHSYETTRSDIENYAPLVRPGGFLVIDDSACRLPHPWGYFAGIETVARAVDALLPPFGKSKIGAQFEHLGAVVHNRIWRRK